MAAPLTVWNCDTCREPIADPGTAVVTYRRDGENRAYDFLLVHKNIDGHRCDPDNAEGYEASLELSGLLGADGLADLLSFLSAGPVKNTPGVVRVADLDGYVDLVRRVQTPWYEEARGLWGTEFTTELVGGAGPTYPYVPDVLEQIASQTVEE